MMTKIDKKIQDQKLQNGPKLQGTNTFAFGLRNDDQLRDRLRFEAFLFVGN